MKFGQFSSISCTSATSCVAVGFNDGGTQEALAELWNGTDWKSMKAAAPPDAESALSDVSCVSASDCLAVGQVDGGPLAELWDGSSWTLENIATTAFLATLGGVSCISAEHCEAVGAAIFAKGSGLQETAIATSWDGTSWTQASKVAGSDNGGLESISCVSAGTCEAVGSVVNQTSGRISTLGESLTSAHWVLQHTPSTGSRVAELNHVSCVSASHCIAVGDAGSESLAETWNGARWSIVATPEPSNVVESVLFGVSCASATGCMAVGSYLGTAGVGRTLAMAWTGKKWVIEPSPSSSTQTSGLLGVSCETQSACTAVGSSEGTKNPSLLLVEVWDGTSWSAQHLFQKRLPLGAGLDDVSCTSSTFCLAVGSDELDDPIAEIWNGASWKRTPAPAGSGGGGLFGVACVSDTDCIAVGAPNTGSEGLAEKWNGKTWTALPTPTGSGPFGSGTLVSVSCSSAESCVAVGSGFGETGPVPLAEVWNGHGWTEVKTPASGSGSLQAQLYSVSCGSADSCVAVGVSVDDEDLGSPIIDSWNGTKWSKDKSAPGSPENFGLTGVSCTSARRCMATGYFFDRLGSPEAFSERSDGTRWTSRKMKTPVGGAVVYGVRCTGEDACVAVGGSGSGALVEGWNGKAWTLEKAVDPVGSGTSTFLDGVDCASLGSCTAVGYYTNNKGFEFTLAEAN